MLKFNLLKVQYAEVQVLRLFCWLKFLVISFLSMRRPTQGSTGYLMQVPALKTQNSK
jgi:hypothetical protein